MEIKEIKIKKKEEKASLNKDGIYFGEDHEGNARILLVLAETVRVLPEDEDKVLTSSKDWIGRTYKVVRKIKITKIEYQVEQ